MTTPSSSPNTLLAIYEKKTTPLDLTTPLHNYITRTYSSHDALSVNDDLQTINTLRSDLQSLTNSPKTRSTLYQNYYKALSTIESRFPISSSNHHVNNLSFTWFDAFKPKLKASQQNISFEKAAVVFNLGAVYSQIGLACESGDVDGRKLASHSFVAAAGAFAYLRDELSMKACVGNSTTLDLSFECVGMLEKLMLAQGQECIYENCIAKGTSYGASSKIARQVGLFYEEVLSALSAFHLNQHFDKAWVAHVQLKAALFYAEACYRYSLELHKKEEIAEEIARLRSGISALSDLKKSSKGAAHQLLDAINKLENNLSHNLERAVKENDRVYLMRVPPASSLAPLPAFSMVKSMPMNDMLDASKEKLFASLVPENSAKALSRYTEMVDDVIRTQAEKLQQGSELARVRLKEMDLPDSVLALEGNSSLPLALREDVEAVQVCGGASGLEGELQQLKDLRRVNHEMLVQVEEQLQKEASEDAQFRSQFGARWTRPLSSTMTKNLQDRLNRFAGNLKQAAESDARIERSVREHSTLMSILDCQPIESALPSMVRPIMSLDASEDAIVGVLKQSLRQLETLGAQRAGLEDMLKDMKRKDDILPKLMSSSTGSHEDLFTKEISKYDHICEEIAQNLEAQEQLMMHIQAQNDEFAAIFNLEDYKASREKCYKQIEAAISKFREIKENINEGLKFYVTLQDAITNVKQQCNEFLMTRSIQCRDMIDDVQRKISGLSFQDSRNSTNYSYPTQLPNSQQPDPRNMLNTYQPPQQPLYQPRQQPHQQPLQQPVYQPNQQPAYSQAPYGAAQQPLPAYHAPVPNYPYPPPQPQQHAQNHEYGPAYPGWRAPYNNAPPQQTGSIPHPPYTIPSPYPPSHQSGYYRQ